MVKSYQMYINGEWVDAASGAYYDDINPYTGEVYARVAAGGAEDATRAVDAAQAAFPGWKKFSAVDRRKLLLKTAELLEQRMNDFVDVLKAETGSTTPFSLFQAFCSPELLREAAAMVMNVHGAIFPSEDPENVNMMWRQPLGVVACISPWNAALLLAFRALVYPLACGNTVVFKTSAESSVTGAMVAQLFDDAGWPKGVFNFVTNGPGASGAIGKVFTDDPRVKNITFTGSSEVGMKLNVDCAKHMKRFCAELGGNCPLIVLNDADLDLAVNAAAFGRFMHQGQVCFSTKRMVVEQGIADAFIEKLAAKAKTLKCGDPQDPEVIIGPLINKTQMEILEKQIERAREQGAKIVTGGKVYGGLVYEPTVLVMTEDMDIAHEEVFGPIASVIVAKDVEDAVRIANDTEYGLSSGIITKNTLLAWEIAEQLEAGCTHINDCTLNDEPHAPLGGMKNSGNGKNGFAAMEEFTTVRWITLHKKPRHYLF